MDEKKVEMTDEEIVKALECCINSEGCDCGNCPYNNNDDCQHRSGEDLLDLIHRLQDENAEQKAEIERLTEWKDKLQDTKDELEQQLIDTGFKEYCEENKRLTDENEELQKQVGELKGKICELVADKCNLVVKEQQAVKDTAKEVLQDISNVIAKYNIVVSKVEIEQVIVKYKESYGVEVE